MSTRIFMAPVFTPFDQSYKLRLQCIPQYAQYLQSKNIKHVLVNGTVGEGVTMNVEERKQVLEEWMKASQATGHTVMAHVGGTNLQNVVDLAKHAERVGVSSILCLCDLFFRPKNSEDLIEYLKIVSAAAPKTPLFYYHIPMYTGVDLNMTELLKRANEVPTLAGLKYTHNDLQEVSQCLDIFDGAYVTYLGNDYLISAAICSGVKHFILTSLNFASDEVYRTEELLKEGKIEEALKIQKTINDVATSLTKFASWNAGFKSFVSQAIGIDLGPVRPPQKSADSDAVRKVVLDWKKRRNLR